MGTTIVINVPDGCGAEPGSTRAMLEKIMSTLDDLTAKVDAQTAALAALRTYVTGIETEIKNLVSGEVLPPTVQERLDLVIAKIDANAQSIAAAGDGDITT